LLVLLYFDPHNMMLFNKISNLPRFAQPFLTVARMKSTYTAVQLGTPGTVDHRIYVKDGPTGTLISPVHDIPLATNTSAVYNMVVEIPRFSNAKLEMSSKLPYNPIVQDKNKKTGAPRFVRNLFPFKGYIHNYGALPQTWEDPAMTDPHTGFPGDGDPLDVCEIGGAVGTPGQVKQVKVVGCMALIDENETDWKILAIDTADPLAAEVSDVADVERVFPGLLAATHTWFRDYKKADGKPANSFASFKTSESSAGEESRVQGRDFALCIIDECNQAWKRGATSYVNDSTGEIAGLATDGQIVQESEVKPYEEWFYAKD
jgi:inorganic pyrophosphatase